MKLGCGVLRPATYNTSYTKLLNPISDYGQDCPYDFGESGITNRICFSTCLVNLVKLEIPFNITKWRLVPARFMHRAPMTNVDG